MSGFITMGSLFDGIGGFPYAASFYGIKTVWASEIIPAAISVTRHHFPDMEHLGDITKLRGGDIPPVHIITFGSPCQSFSIAGGRKGLDGKSGLFWEAIRIIREMREATNDKYPRYSIFENVPGILSANRGRDYKIVLEAFTETEIPIPPSGKWTNAGMVRGGRTDLAWIIHDAQYFGVAQRRRRLFAVCDFTGQRAAEILFKPKSLYWYFTQSSEAREGTAPNAPRGAYDASGDCLTPWDAQSRRIFDKQAVWPTLYGGEGGGHGYVAGDETDNTAEPDGLETVAAFLGGQGAAAGSIAYNERVSPTLKSGASGSNMVPCVCEPPMTMRIRQGCEGGGKGALIQTDKSGTLATGNDQILFAAAENEHKNTAYSFDSLSSNSMKSKNPHSGCREVDIAKTIDTTSPCPSKNQGGIAILQECEPQLARTLTARADSSPCVDRGQNIVVCAATTQVNAEICADLCPTITEAAGKSGNNKPYIALGVNQNAEGSLRTAATAYALTTSSNASGRNAPLVCHPEIAGTLCASGAGLSRPAGMGSETDLCIVTEADPNPAVCGTLCAKSIAPNGIGNEADMCILQEPQAFTHLGFGHYEESDKSKTILSNDKAATADIVAYCLQGNMIGREDKNGPQGNGVNNGICFTLSAADRHAIAAVFSRQRSDLFKSDSLASTQTARQSKDATDLVCQNPTAVDCRNLRETKEISGTLQAKESGSYSLNYINPVRKGYIVRRLTPTECERLQGYGDGWTEHGHDGKPLSDTARYQALGNSVAIPCVAYVISGIIDEFLNEMGVTDDERSS